MKLFACSAAVLSALLLASAAGAQPSQIDPAPSPAALEQARHVIQTMHAQKMYDQVFAAMEPSMVAAMGKNLPEDKRQKVQAAEQALFEEMRAMTPKLVDEMAVIYATDFTEQELADMDRFYASSSGQSVIAKMPRVTQQLVPFVMAQMPAILARAFDKSCEKAACTAEQRAAMAKAIDAMKARAAAQPG
jgi:uncharacterized protein